MRELPGEGRREGRQGLSEVAEVDSAEGRGEGNLADQGITLRKWVIGARSRRQQTVSSPSRSDYHPDGGGAAAWREIASRRAADQTQLTQIQLLQTLDLPLSKHTFTNENLL